MSAAAAASCGEVAVGGFDEQVVVVTHLTVGVADPVEAFADLPQDLQFYFVAR